MPGMMPHMSPLTLARESNAMAKESGNAVFQKSAMVMMGVMAAASVGQILHLLLQDLNRHARDRELESGHGHGWSR